MKYVIYRRVSRQSQGLNGLGMDAQEHLIRQHIARAPGEIVGEYAEVETGKRNDRPELQKAIAACREHSATLLIAKIDRLARRASFVLGLRDSGIKFTAADMPEANELTIGLLSCLAEHERSQIASRTKQALEAAKRRGTKLGNPRWQQALQSANVRRAERTQHHAEQLRPVIQEIREKAGVTSLRGVATALTLRGYRTIGGKAFRAQTVANLMAA